MDKKVITDHFRGNIFEAYSHYNVWKMIAYSKSAGVVSQKMAERYVEIQRYHAEFFTLAERAFLISFVMLILHPFDKDDRSFSLRKIDQARTEQFIDENKEVLEELSEVRNKVFAHSDIDPETGAIPKKFIPSVDRLDGFFKNLIAYYNQLTSEIDDSHTMFSNAEDMKTDVEAVFMNLYRGEAVRLKEINIEWDWAKDSKKISDVI